jgi:hypothetical protein
MTSNIKAILILGSKGGAIFDNFDVAYCSNLAALYYRDKIGSPNVRVISVISAGSFNYQYYKENLVKMEPDDVVLTMTDRYPSCVEKIKTISDVFERAVLVDSSSVLSLSHEIAGLKQPILGSPTFFDRSLKSKLKIAFLYGKEKMLSILQDSDASPLFRPSTGIVSLLYAIRIHGKNAKYIVSGIGAGERQIQANGFFNGAIPDIQDKIFLQQHVAADVIIIRRLLKLSYRIEVMDDVLRSLVEKRYMN